MSIVSLVGKGKFGKTSKSVNILWNWLQLTLRKKCLYSKLFWSVFFCIRTECGEILRISPYSVRMRENADQNNSEYGHFSRSSSYTIISKLDIFALVALFHCMIFAIVLFHSTFKLWMWLYLKLFLLWVTFCKISKNMDILWPVDFGDFLSSFALHEKCPYSEFFWSVFSRIRTEYREILRISPYSVRMWENKEQKTLNTDILHAVLLFSRYCFVKIRYLFKVLYWHMFQIIENENSPPLIHSFRPVKTKIHRNATARKNENKILILIKNID